VSEMRFQKIYMKFLIGLFFFLASYTVTLAQCNKINFVNASLSFAYNKAQTENKPIFIFIYEENDVKANFFQSGIFYKPEICKLFNEKFINVKATTTSSIGKDIIRQHRIDRFPAFVVLDKYRSLRQKTSDIRSSPDLMSFAKRVR